MAVPSERFFEKAQKKISGGHYDLAADRQKSE
jgi:hypothetical protein